MQKNSCCGTFQILLPNIFKENTKIRETRSFKEQLEKTKSSKFLSWKVWNKIGKNEVNRNFLTSDFPTCRFFPTALLFRDTYSSKRQFEKREVPNSELGKF